MNRDEFLRKTFGNAPSYVVERIVELGPASILTPEAIDRAADSIIKAHTLTATALSAAAGIPGGIGLIATIPADLANYYYHIVSVGQKLGYLYGWPDMLDAKEELTPDGQMALTAFIAVMNKVALAQELVKAMAREAAVRVSSETAAKVAGKLLSKQIVGQMAEAVARRLGHRITASSGGKAITRAIPLVSGVICGSVTYVGFRRQAFRLKEVLRGK